jgi:alpha-D-ribose 1-methylphosphonate 5-triphosphate synthase subunit PhnG
VLRREQKGTLGLLDVQSRAGGAGHPVAHGVSEVGDCAVGTEAGTGKLSNQ